MGREEGPLGRKKGRAEKARALAVATAALAAPGARAAALLLAVPTRPLPLHARRALARAAASGVHASSSHFLSHFPLHIQQTLFNSKRILHTSLFTTFSSHLSLHTSLFTPLLLTIKAILAAARLAEAEAVGAAVRGVMRGGGDVWPVGGRGGVARMRGGGASRTRTSYCTLSPCSTTSHAVCQALCPCGR